MIFWRLNWALSLSEPDLWLWCPERQKLKWNCIFFSHGFGFTKKYYFGYPGHQCNDCTKWIGESADAVVFYVLWLMVVTYIWLVIRYWLSCIWPRVVYIRLGNLTCEFLHCELLEVQKFIWFEYITHYMCGYVRTSSRRSAIKDD